MRAFAATVEMGSLSAAGRLLGLAPPTITRRINELEAALGVTLLHRTTRSLSLTEAGEIYYERARGILQAVDEANLAVTEKRAAPSGTLRITAASSVARRHVAPAVAAFQMQYRNVRAVMNVTDRIVDVVDERQDVAIRIGRLEDSSLVARKLGMARRLVCASPSYLNKAGRPTHPNELSAHSCLTFRSHPGSNLWRFRDAGGVVEVSATGAFFTDDGETMMSAAISGLGLVLVPEWLAGEDLGNGRLEEVLKDHAPDPADTPLYAVHAPGPYTAPKVRAFIDFLVGRFSHDYAWCGRH